MQGYTIIFTIILSLLLAANLSAEQRAIKVSPKAKEQRLALLIGNSDYTHGGNLGNPVNDVRAIKRALESLGFTVLKYENCTQKAMKRAMDKFGRKLKGQDVGLFFYAGHGVQVNGYNYLVPTDAKLVGENEAEYDCVRAGRILAKMERAGSRTNIVILDACRDNPFERSWRRGTEGTGLAFMNAPSGSLIAYSTAPGKTALDGTGRNSIYTSALLQHIDTPNLTVLQMFQRVRSTVMDRSGNKQTPWESTSLRGDFYFNKDSGTAVVEPPEQIRVNPVGDTVNQFEKIIGDENIRILNWKRIWTGSPTRVTWKAIEGLNEYKVLTDAVKEKKKRSFLLWKWLDSNMKNMMPWNKIANSKKYKELAKADKEDIKERFREKLAESSYLSIVYQSKIEIKDRKTKIVVDCFDKNGTPVPGVSSRIPAVREHLSRGEVREVDITLPPGTFSYKIRLN